MKTRFTKTTLNRLIALLLMVFYLLIAPGNVDGLDLDALLKKSKETVEQYNVNKYNEAAAVTAPVDNSADTCGEWDIFCFLAKLAQRLIKKGNIPAVAFKLKAVMRIDPNDMKNMLLLAKVYLQKLRLITKAESGFANTPETLYKSVSVELLLNNLEIWELAFGNKGMTG